MHDGPLAYFITWTVYGTHLQGHSKGWMKQGRGLVVAQPRLELWHSGRLNHSVELLDERSRYCVSKSIEDVCTYRNWKLWASNPRTNHVHAVVTAIGYPGDVVRDQLKAKCTRELRAINPRFRDRTVWSRGGDWALIDTEEELEVFIEYVRDAQDRKDQ